MMKSDQFPRGKLNEDDEGALPMRVGIYGNTLILDFGKHVDWIGFGYQEAVDFANLILQTAEKIKPNS